jgi:ketosteroid isomerase-like protein
MRFAQVWTFRDGLVARVEMYADRDDALEARAQLEGRAYHGRDGLRRFIVELAEDWEEVRFEVDEVRETGGQLVGFGRFRARGKASGIELNVPLGLVGVVQDRKVVYSRFFSDPADALEAAGLEE